MPLEAKYYEVQAYVHAGRNEEAIAELTAYLEATGREGEHYQEALRQLLRLNERMAADDETFAGAKRAGTAVAYGAYLREYPHGRHVAEAQRLQAEAANREDDAAYVRAQRAATAAGYGEYLRQYPRGRHAAEALRLQREAERAERWELGGEIPGLRGMSGGGGGTSGELHDGFAGVGREARG